MGMRSRWAAVAALGVVAMVVAGCGNDAAPAGPMVLRAEGVERVQPPADAPVAAVVAGIARFGYELAPRDDANWVASPASIAIALAMARAGAGGTTAAEIDKVFGFPSSGLHEAFNSLTRQVVTAERPPPRDEAAERKPGSPPGPTTVCVGNALFPAKDFPISDGFLHTLAAQYGTGVYPVDFHEAAAKDAIDEWAKQQTADRIKKVFDQLDADTAMVLANTVYLKGDWKHGFDSSSTVDADFHRADSSTVRVPMMHQQAELDYAEADGWQAVQLPYGSDGAFAMRILLPTGTATPRDLLAPQVQAEVSRRLESQVVDLALPRWDFAADVALADELKRLGVVSAFDQGLADFSGMSTKRLYIGQAIHRATITVDENGTEAAAVTALQMMPTSAPPEPTATLHADHPFAFAIVHVATGTPLFIGQVADPSAH